MKTDKGNYRPIALETACSKILKICLLKMLEIYWTPMIISLALKVCMLRTCELLQVKV